MYSKPERVGVQMGKYRLVLFLIVVFGTGRVMQSYAQYSDTVKIMTYNINAESHGSGSYSDIAEVINEIGPTINGIQKLDSCNSRNSTYVLQYLGEQTDMAYTFAAAQTNFQGGNGSYGVGFLSGEEPLSVRRLAIPKGNASEDRAALEIGITMAGERVRLIVTHLDYASAANRTVQIQQILPWIDSGGAETDPVVIMADFNARATESSMQLFEDAGFDYVKGENGEVLDTAQNINHILFRPVDRWSILSVGNPAYSASNRYPLWAQMQLLDPVAAKKNQNVPHIRNSIGRFTIAGDGIRFEVGRESRVSCELVGISGRKIGTFVDGHMLAAGTHVFHLPEGVFTDGAAVVAITVNGKRMVKGVVTAK
ncbi:MAG: hypothetical protein JW863_12725 [Chitinispirillaceae bacterium]|nr:hypothetical protein [Chitinispirillaceae bacterium]